MIAFDECYGSLVVSCSNADNTWISLVICVCLVACLLLIWSNDVVVPS